MKKTYINGHIFVGDSEDHFANGMIVENGRIKWIGNDPVPEGETIDLQGQTVLPGLIDCHTHPKYIADALHGVACTPPNVNSIKEMQEALRKSPAYGKGEDVWIEGWGFDETKLAEHRSPNRDDLDAVSTTQPIFIYRSDCHSSVGNSKALELAGIDENTPDPVGGKIERFADGRPTGFMREVAASQLLIRAKSAQSYEGDVQNMVKSSEHYLANGLVAIGEMMGRMKPYTSLKLYQDAIKGGFAPKASFIIMLPLLNHLMMIVDPALFRCNICGGNDIVWGFDNIPESFILKCSLGDESHVSGCGIVVIGIQAIGIDKMGILASQLLGPLVHHIYKRLDGPADIFCHSGRNFIGRAQEDTIKTLLHRQSFPWLNADMSASWLDIVYLVGKCDFCVQGNLFNGQHSSHDLCNAGRCPFLVNTFGIQDFSGVQVHEDSCFSNDLRTLRPSGNIVGLNFPFVAFRHGRFLIFSRGICLSVFLYRFRDVRSCQGSDSLHVKRQSCGQDQSCAGLFLFRFHF